VTRLGYFDSMRLYKCKCNISAEIFSRWLLKYFESFKMKFRNHLQIKSLQCNVFSLLAALQVSVQ